MPLDFPNSPTVGQVFTSAGISWAWDGVKWTSAYGSAGAFLPLSGGTVSGDVHVTKTLDADTGVFGGVAGVAMRTTGSETWVGQSDRGYMSYYDSCSLAAFYPPAGPYTLAVVAAVRTSDHVGSPSGANIAYSAYATSDSTADTQAATWSYYGTNRRVVGSGTTIGAEFSMGNLGEAVELNPYQTGVIGSSIGCWLSSGSEAITAGLTVNPASAAIGVVSNGSTWSKGIVFGYNALVADGNGHMRAIQLPRLAEVQWTYDGSNTRSGFIRADTSGSGLGIVFKAGPTFNVVDATTETSRFVVNSGGDGSFTGLLQIGGGTGPTWTTGSGVPSSTQPVGSLYSRTGGAVGATLYVSRGGGTWAAVAGV